MKMVMFKITHGHSGLEKDDIVSPSPGMRALGHRTKVAKKPAVSQIRRNHFTQVVSDWNALPEQTVCCLLSSKGVPKPARQALELVYNSQCSTIIRNTVNVTRG